MRFNDIYSGLPRFRKQLAECGIVKLRDVEELSDEQLTEFSQGLSDEPDEKILEWEFGHIMRMKCDPNAANYLFSAERVPLHWDGAFHREPRFLVFYCDASAGDGGATNFVNTETILGEVDAEAVKGWRGIHLTYSTEKKAHYGGTFTTAMVRSHPFHGRNTLRFAEVVKTERNPVDLKISGTREVDFYDRMERLVTDEHYCDRHTWQRGDLVVVDNHSYLHGREALGANSGRSFRRIQVL